MTEVTRGRRAEDDMRSRKRLRRGMYILPSLFTSANIGAGYFAITQAIQGTAAEPWHFDNAAKAIGFAILFDGLDGRIARMTNTTSDFGRELDSLADVITFGLAPAVLAMQWGFRWLPEFANADLRVRLIQLGAIATFLFLIAGALRLARFNIQKNPQPSNPGRPGKKYFVGMPIPGGAGIIAAVVHFAHGNPMQTWWVSAIWVAFVISLGYLMVSTWRFYSFKDINLKQRRPARLLFVMGALIAAIWFYSDYALFILGLIYMLSGVLARLTFVLRRSDPVTASTEASDL